MNEKIELLIIVLNYKNFVLTIDCVNSLLSDVKERCHIVVVDNMSPNDSYTILEDALGDKEGVFLTKTDKNGGYSAGNNFGLKYMISKGYEYDYICIMNPDIKMYDASTMTKIVANLKQHDDVALASGLQIYNNTILGRVKNFWKLPNKFSCIVDHSFKDYFSKGRLMTYKFIDKGIEPDVISGCFFVIKFDVFKEIGFFDEGVFLYYEENILSQKIRKLGLNCSVCLDSFFYHNHVQIKQKNVKDLLREKKIQMKSKRYFYTKYLTNNIFLVFLFDLFSLFDKVICIFVFCVYGLKKCIFCTKKEI